MPYLQKIESSMISFKPFYRVQTNWAFFDIKLRSLGAPIREESVSLPNGAIKIVDTYKDGSSAINIDNYKPGVVDRSSSTIIRSSGRVIIRKREQFKNLLTILKSSFIRKNGDKICRDTLLDKDGSILKFTKLIKNRNGNYKKIIKTYQSGQGQEFLEKFNKEKGIKKVINLVTGETSKLRYDSFSRNWINVD